MTDAPVKESGGNGKYIGIGVLIGLCVGIGAGVGIGVATAPKKDASPSPSPSAPPPPPPSPALPSPMSPPPPYMLTDALAKQQSLMGSNALTQIMYMARPDTTPAATLLNEVTGLAPVGTHTAHICEATDAAYSTVMPLDGQSGDTDYPYGKIKVLATVGEYDKTSGFMLVGVPDGMGAYLKDDTTVRIVWQSESYGPINWWSNVKGSFDSYPFIVNSNGASFTGSHVMYVDYDRDKLADFMNNANSAASMVKAAGNLIQNAYNLKGDLIGPRKKDGDGCSAAPHFSNTDPNGCNQNWNTIMNGDTTLAGNEAAPEPEQADWVMQSLCSAHLEEKHQWGVDLGVEDDLFVTNEEWTMFVGGSDYTGIPAHVVDLSNGNMYATGVFTLGGFEKIVEINCGHTDYVCFSPSGYNGNFGEYAMANGKAGEAARKNALGKRPDGTDYVWPKYVVPSRIYIGKKGVNAQGQAATDFLSKNGLAYGKLYGFSTNMTATGTGTANGLFMDAYSKVAAPGSTVNGAFYPLDWQWDGQVRSFLYDGSWAFQHLTVDGQPFWNSKGRDSGGSKTEHNSPDPYGGARYIQSSTAGHFGIFDFTGVTALLTAANGGFPTKVPAVYTLLQGEQDITSQIQLGGKGRKANGQDQTTMSDKYSVAGDGTITDSAKVTFEDIDGFEWIAASGTTNGYVVIQEDGGNDFGERTFISKVQTDGTPMTFYFIAMSGGDDNTRNKKLVGVPAGTNVGMWDASSAHEFSGVIDLSGMLAKSGNSYVVSAGNGAARRNADKNVAINDKIIAMGLQAHSLTGGVIHAFRGDRGGQIYAYQPNGLP